MGQGIIGQSKSIEYSTPLEIVEPLIKEYNLTKDVCASSLNCKLPDYWTKNDNALLKQWTGNCWLNPPFNRELGKWVKKAHSETIKNGGTKVCLIPVRSNTKWWAEVSKDAEIRFINGEVNFNNQVRGLWLPLCILIFGELANVGKFSIINYRK
jgi:phage N-6-adenine-methyltransferase